MLRAVIIDDVAIIREKNCSLIQLHCPSITIVGQASSVASGINAILEHAPDIVFLDIEMEDGTGFDLLQKLPFVAFKVIFVTAYQEFAIKPFKCSAVDYLLKPIAPAELIEAVNKAQQLVNNDLVQLTLTTLLKNIEQPNTLKKIILKTHDKLHAVALQDVVYCESDKNYTSFYLINGQIIIVLVTLKEYETMLDNYNFFRPHKSFLINMLHFDCFVKTDSVIHMKNNAVIPLSVRKREEFIQLLAVL